MGGAADLKVNVEELNTCASDISAVCEGIDSVMASLVRNLQSTSTGGLQSGTAADSFSAFVSEIAKLNGRIKDIGTSISSIITRFLAEIDEADDLLFPNSGYKPFTEDEFDNCLNIAKSSTAYAKNRFDLVAKINALISNLFKWIWRAADLEATVGNDQAILRSRFEELEEQTFSKLSEIKAGVRLADRTNQQSLTQQLDLLQLYKQALLQIDNILSSEGGTISAESLSTLSWVVDEGKLLTGKIYTVPDENVRDFAKNVEGYFDYSTGVISAVCVGSFANFLISDFDEYRATVNSALDYFNSYSSHYTSEYEKYERYKGDFDKMLELYNKYGSSWVDYYDGDKEKAAMFNKLVKKTGEVSKKADDYVDIWFQLFCDMTESQEAFARFKENYDLNDPNVLKALERVEALYNGEVDAYVYETLEHISQEVKKVAIEKGAEAVIEAYNKIAPVNGVDQIMSKAASSVLDRAFSEAPAVAQHDWVVTTQNSFDNAIVDLKAATPGTEGYDMLVQTVRESFDCAKEARIKFFTTMMENTSIAEEKRYYELSLESIKSMSLNDAAPHIAISPDEYFGSDPDATLFDELFDGNITVSNVKL